MLRRAFLLLLVAGAAACAPVARSAAIVPEPGASSAWSADHAVAALRSVLRSQPFLEDAVEGPMVALAAEEYPARESGRPVALDAYWWPDHAWVVETQTGRWWVWPGGQVAPADPAAAALAAHLPIRLSLDHVVDWR
jgi:hypothetical protein